MAMIVPFIMPRGFHPVTKTAPSLLVNFLTTLEICQQNTRLKTVTEWADCYSAHIMKV